MSKEQQRRPSEGLDDHHGHSPSSLPCCCSVKTIPIQNPLLIVSAKAGLEWLSTTLTSNNDDDDKAAAPSANEPCWTKEEYEVLIDQVLRRYASPASKYGRRRSTSAKIQQHHVEVVREATVAPSGRCCCWTKEEYEALIEQNLRRYASAASVAERMLINDRDNVREIRGGNNQQSTLVLHTSR